MPAPWTATKTPFGEGWRRPFPGQGYVTFNREALSPKHLQGEGRAESSLREGPIIGKAFGSDLSNVMK